MDGEIGGPHQLGSPRESLGHDVGDAALAVVLLAGNHLAADGLLYPGFGDHVLHGVLSLSKLLLEGG